MTNFSELLNKQKKSVLVQLLLDISQKYPELENEICAKFGALDELEDINQTKEDIRDIINCNRYQGFINWRGCDDIMDSFDLIIDKGLIRLNQGYYVTSYSIILEIIEKTMKLASVADSSSGSLTITLERAIESLNIIVQEISTLNDEKVKNNLFNAIIKTCKKKLFDGWSSDRYIVMNSVIPLVTDKNASKLLNLSKKIIENNTSEYSYEITLEEDVILQANVFNKLNNEEKAIKLLNDNLNYDDVRKYRIHIAIEKLDFELAEKLSLDKISDCIHKHYRVSEWYELLDVIYISSNQNSKRIENMKNMVKEGNLEKYKLLKDLMLEEGSWDVDYASLLDDLNKCLDVYYYAYILDFEEEWSKLYELIKDNYDLVEKYGRKVYDLYPKEITEIIRKQLNDMLKFVSDRRAYKKMGEFIMDYARYGDEDIAVEWINLIKDTPENKRKSALQDEMEKVLSALN